MSWLQGQPADDITTLYKRLLKSNQALLLGRRMPAHVQVGRILLARPDGRISNEGVLRLALRNLRVMSVNLTAGIRHLVSVILVDESNL